MHFQYHGATPVAAFYAWSSGQAILKAHEKAMVSAADRASLPFEVLPMPVQTVKPGIPGWVWVVLAMVIGMFAGFALVLDHGWRG